MNRRTLAGAFALLATIGLSAQNYDSYYTDLPVGLARPAVPAFPDHEVDIADFGGKGDGLTLNTQAFEQAMAALTAKGGGRLTVKAGVWLTGPIELTDNINLHIEKNAIIYFAADKRLYESGGKSKRCKPCISASGRKNIAITGEGIVDGNGSLWRPVKRGKVSDVEWKAFAAMGGVERKNGELWYPWQMKNGYPDIAETPEAQERMRNDLVRLTNCDGILIQGVTFQNAPRFHVHPVNSQNIIIDNITVRCPWNAQNGDAIDLSDCHKALIVNSTVDAGDDGLCMKSGGFKEKAVANGCEDILIENNTVYHAHGGFVIGSESMTGMKRIVVRNCRFAGTDEGLRFKSAMGRGGRTEAIYISNIVMTDISGSAISLKCNYEDKPAGGKAQPEPTDKPTDFVPEFADIHISDIVCHGAKTGIAAAGLEGFESVHDISISNSTIVYRGKACDIDEATARITLDNVNFVADKAQ